jgi:mRNA interferase RelE/StbE
MLRIDLSKQAIEFLEDLPNKQSKQILNKIDALLLNPNSVPSGLIKGGNGERRIKAGEFRIIYEIMDNLLTIWLIDRRNDDKIYRQMKRLQ